MGGLFALGANAAEAVDVVTDLATEAAATAKEELLTPEYERMLDAKRRILNDTLPNRGFRTAPEGPVPT